MLNHRIEENRFATAEEFFQGLQRQRADESLAASGVPLYNRNNTIYADISDSHTLIFGNTGTKKTRNFCVPSVYSIGQAGESMIISDPKGEIYRYTSGYLHKEGYQIYVLNLRDVQYSAGWNPLTLPYRYYKEGNKDKAVEMVADFAMQLKALVHSDKEVFWENSAMDLFIGLVLMLFECTHSESVVNMASVQNIRMYIEVEGQGHYQDAFWDFLDTFPEESIVRYRLSAISSLRTTERTLSSILSIFDCMMNVFLFNEKMMGMLSETEINLDSLAERKTVIFLITPDEKTTFHFLVSVFVKKSYEFLIQRAHDNPDGQLKIRINFILDEFSNFPRISDMPAMISAARSRNIRFILVVQSKQQLTSMYKDDCETIKSNCKNWIFLSCREVTLLREIEFLCGYVSTPEGINMPLMNTTRLQSLKIGWIDSEALILRNGSRPFVTNVRDFSSYPQAACPPIPFIPQQFKKPQTFSMLDYMYNYYIRLSRE